MKGCIPDLACCPGKVGDGCTALAGHSDVPARILVSIIRQAINMLSNIKIGVRLALGFGLIMVLMLGTLYVNFVQLRSIERLSKQVTAEEWPVSVVANQIIRNINNNAKAALSLMFMSDIGQIERTVAEMTEISKGLTGLYEYLEQTLTTPAEQELLATILAARSAYVGSRKQAIKLALDSRPDAARIRLITETMPLHDAYIKAIHVLIESAEKSVEAAGRQTEDIIARSITLSISLGLAMLLLALGSGIWLVRSIVRPLRQAVSAVDQIAAGDLSVELASASADEVGQLMQSMRRMQKTLHALIAEMNRMSREHDRGEIDARIDEDGFKGDFRVMAAGVNGMVFGHIALYREAMDCVKEFGNGNMDAPLATFPGKKAFINETIEQVRGNIQVLIADTRRLSDAALNGQLDIRADASRHRGDFRLIIEGINGMLDAVVSPVNAVMRILTLMEDGHLSETITAEYKGQLQELRNTLNNTVAKLAQTMRDVRATADDLTAAAEQVNMTAQTLSQGAAEQASGVEETSASMEQMSASVAQNTENASVTDGMAAKAAKEAREGGIAVKETVAAMKQ
ncbi:MCP four helix bundle domain-containing protein, partial [Thiobaca trueperi]